jgi:hypothetical protein
LSGGIRDLLIWNFYSFTFTPQNFTMSRWLCICLAVLLVSCGGDGDTASLTEEAVGIKDFIEAFPDMKVPVTIADSNLAKFGDTTSINPALVEKYLPVNVDFAKAKGKAVVGVKPIGKIKRDNETYLLIKHALNKSAAVSVIVYDKENQFKEAKELVSNLKDDGYVHSVSINREPTFTISREMITKDNQQKYSRTGWAYSEGKFMVVINDSNEDQNRNDSIINPIDTLRKTFAYSGEYIKDKKNFVSLRDGSSPNQYRFFIHFEKNDGDCIGELKGELTMKDDKTGQYASTGDPCVINFKFSASKVEVKEEGSCGNHRGIKCFFNDSYNKKKEARPRRSGRR